MPAGGFDRAYRQQPPLIPHKIDGYQISTENNACMGCHDWPGNARVNAPKISKKQVAYLKNTASKHWVADPATGGLCLLPVVQ